MLNIKSASDFKMICTISLVSVLLMSCSHSFQLVHKSQATGAKVKFYFASNLEKGGVKFYSRVDSSNIVIFYRYRIDNIYKTYRNEDNYIYTLVSGDAVVPVIPYSKIDSIVLEKGDRILDSLNLENVKRARGSTGFVQEVSGH